MPLPQADFFFCFFSPDTPGVSFHLKNKKSRMADILSRDSKPPSKRRRLQKQLVLTLPIAEDPKSAGAHEPIVFQQPIEASKDTAPQKIIQLQTLL